MSTISPSAVRWTSISTWSAPISSAARIAARVFSGAVPDAPRCATTSGPAVPGTVPPGRWAGSAAAAEVGASSAAPTSAATATNPPRPAVERRGAAESRSRRVSSPSDSQYAMRSLQECGGLGGWSPSGVTGK
ncbi:hypothetical protein [Actinoalloteichus caeruleus]|uniref:hypothetical protein n=1 Tax=Actinoalloteichus cyanogriseus TaxID=2893586 RepID=UPI0020A35FC7|nr:hypothetical protein [Actinoalloteichus caeruleus]